jgi:uncharacterized protein YoxC
MSDAFQLSAALQVALILASVAIIGLVACLIPLALQARRQLDELALIAGQLKTNLDALIHDSRELVRNANELTTRASRQMDEVDQVVGTVRQWTERADQLVDQVGAVVEPSVFSLVRNMNLIRTGVTTFIQAFLHRNHPPTAPHNHNNRGE